MTDKFNSIGFQTKAIAAILQNKEFLEQIFDIVDVTYFEESYEWIVSKILWYFELYKEVPTKDIFKNEIDKITDITKKVAIIDSISNIYRVFNSTDIPYIEKEFLKFCKDAAMKNALLASVDLLKTNNYEKINNLVSKALTAGQSKNIGHNWNEDLKIRTTDISRGVISTGWAVIDNIIDGGSSAGELFSIIGPVGGGKSWALSSIGVSAARIGKIVVHYTLELSEKYTGLRYDSIVSGIEPTKIKHNYKLVKEKLEEIPGKIIIKEFPTKSITYHALSAHIERMIMLGNKPDLVIVDYADLLRGSEKSEAKYQELGTIYEDLRRLAGEKQVPVFTCSQAQRSATDDIIEGDKIAESYSKLFVADFVMSIQRKKEDKIANTAKVFIIKNRMGKDGLIFPMEFNTERGYFEIYEPNSPQGIALMERSAPIDVKEVMRKKLEQYKDIDLG